MRERRREGGRQRPSPPAPRVPPRHFQTRRCRGNRCGLGAPPLFPKSGRRERGRAGAPGSPARSGSVPGGRRGQRCGAPGGGSSWWSTGGSVRCIPMAPGSGIPGIRRAPGGRRLKLTERRPAAFQVGREALDCHRKEQRGLPGVRGLSREGSPRSGPGMGLGFGAGQSLPASQSRHFPGIFPCF